MEPTKNEVLSSGSITTNSTPPSTENPQTQEPTLESASSFKAFFIYAIIALAIAVFVRFFIAAPYIVSGASMDPTFSSWHYLIIDRVTYQIEEPQRGDVVVFRFPQDPSRSFIKRIIGLPGETVSLSGDIVTIMNDENPEGFILTEEYIAPENHRAANVTTELQDGEYFVMGDNRKASADSRIWGPLPKEFIVGRAYFRLFPITQFSVLPGEVRYSDTTLQ